MITETTTTNNELKPLQEPATKELTLQEKKELLEKELVAQWKEKRAKNLSSFSYKTREEGNKLYLAPEFKNSSPHVTEHQQSEIERATLCARTGTTSERYGRILSQELAGALTGYNIYDKALIINAACEAMREMAPQDVYEGMLCSRLIALNNQTMYFMNKSANPDANTQTIDLNVNRVAKFTRLYNETLETLLRYRRKGEQKVTVQHVNVNNGGQAIVTGKLS